MYSQDSGRNDFHTRSYERGRKDDSYGYGGEGNKSGVGRSNGVGVCGERASNNGGASRSNSFERGGRNSNCAGGSMENSSFNISHRNLISCDSGPSFTTLYNEPRNVERLSRNARPTFATDKPGSFECSSAPLNSTDGDSFAPLNSTDGKSLVTIDSNSNVMPFRRMGGSFPQGDDTRHGAEQENSYGGYLGNRSLSLNEQHHNHKHQERPLRFDQHYARQTLTPSYSASYGYLPIPEYLQNQVSYNHFGSPGISSVDSVYDNSARHADLNLSPVSMQHKKFQNVRVFKSQSLGRGSYGAVYRAKCDHVLTCAAKVIHPILFTSSPESKSPLSRFTVECELMSSFRHPNVVQYLGTWLDADNSLVLLMELMDESLTRFLENSREPLSFSTEVNICHDIALALAYLHSNGIIHRDLSSNNVLMLGDRQAKITDFGMAKVFDSDRSLHSATVCPGALVYMPPEVINEMSAVHTDKVDCFSFGVLMVQVISRQFPKPGDRTKVLPTGGRAVVSEVERRTNHIDLIDSRHPLKEMVLSCLCDNGAGRPSAVNISQQLEHYRLQDCRGRRERSASGREEASDGARCVEVAEKDDSIANLTAANDKVVAKLELEVSSLKKELQETILRLERSESSYPADVKEMATELDSKKQELHIDACTTPLPPPLIGRNPKDPLSPFTDLSLSLGAVSLATKVSSPPTTTRPHQRKLSRRISDIHAPEKSTVGEQSSINMELVWTNEEEGGSEEPFPLEATFESLVDNSKMHLVSQTPVLTSITRKRQWCLPFTPHVRGRHVLSLTDGKQVTTRDMFAQIPAYRMRDPVKKLTVTRGLCHLAIHSSFIYCTLMDSNLIRLLHRENCNEILSIKCTRKVRGIAVDPSGNVYVTGDHIVEKYSLDTGKVLASCGGSKPREFKSPQGIGYYDHQVYVCDTGNSRVTVYDSELNYVRKLLHKCPSMNPGNRLVCDLQSPEHITFDGAGRAFVIDSKNKYIAVYGRDGNYRNEISSRGNEPLQMPRAICIINNHLFVTDTHCVHVYNVKSKVQVHKISVQEDPLGVCVDEDGFLYVACSGGKKSNSVVVY